MHGSDKKVLLYSKNVKYIMEYVYLNKKIPEDGQ
jgi:hypothetical protein